MPPGDSVCVLSQLRLSSWLSLFRASRSFKLRPAAAAVTVASLVLQFPLLLSLLILLLLLLLLLLPLSRLLATGLQDFSDAGTLVLAAGQHVLCDVIFPFNKGQMLCDVLQPGSGTKPLHLPPAILGPCSSFLKTGYRSVLPAHMQRPNATMALQPSVPHATQL